MHTTHVHAHVAATRGCSTFPHSLNPHAGSPPAPEDVTSAPAPATTASGKNESQATPGALAATTGGAAKAPAVVTKATSRIQQTQRDARAWISNFTDRSKRAATAESWRQHERPVPATTPAPSVQELKRVVSSADRKLTAAADKAQGQGPAKGPWEAFLAWLRSLWQAILHLLGNGSGSGAGAANGSGSGTGAANGSGSGAGAANAA
jgi:hypothetical protein